ncbi:MAG: hypothetical protein M3R36_03345 [Bacteroidota bacterium]|nr:hypothetical protein [Bacteroidota bacterium]
MNKIKIPGKKRRSSASDSDKSRFENKYHPRTYIKIILYVIIGIIPVITSFIYLRNAFSQNAVFSFPLDDPWIHLTFAKNLAQYFSFSYFKNEMATSGSTSPLYTIIVALGFFVTKNEMAISYILGMLFFSLAAISFYKLSLFEFDNEGLFAFLCAGIFVLDKGMNFISVSGMETTMFIFILILCAYFYKKRKAIPFAIMLGLILWTRPDGIVFIIAAVIDYILVMIYSKNDDNLDLFSKKELKLISVIFLGIVGLYFGLNLLLSGSLLPNTYSAKLAYYSPELRNRMNFLKYEVWEYFKTGSYFLLLIGFIFSILKLIYDISKKTYNKNTIYVLFILGLIFVYFLKLPYAHRFGRYMMPIIPFFILVATIGFRDLARMFNKYTENLLFSKVSFYILIGITYFIGFKNYEEYKDVYAYECKYIYDRQVKAAQWLKKNTKETDIIATHDVGAIGFYSERKIVDAVGLVTPELIKNISDKNYVDTLTKYMKDNKVTYLAFMKEWYRVSNQNFLYTSHEPSTPEAIEVHNFWSDKTEILSPEANSMILNSASLLSQKAGQQLIVVSNRILSLEPKSSYAYFLRALGFNVIKDKINYEKNLLKAVEIFPDYKEANLTLGIFYKNESRLEESNKYLSKALQVDPGNAVVMNNLRIVKNLLNAKDKSSN